MELDEFRQLGFPDIPATRAAITEPELMETPLHAAGFSVARMDPSGRVLTDPPNPHTTYNTQLAGEYVGGLELPVPREIMFPDFHNLRRISGAPERGDARAFSLANVIQPTNQEWLDGVMGYMERARGLLD
jgi:hypothetical protein